MMSPAMWSHRSLSRIDFRTIPIILALMFISLLVISATTGGGNRSDDAPGASFQDPGVGVGHLVLAGGWEIDFQYHDEEELNAGPRSARFAGGFGRPVCYSNE